MTNRVAMLVSDLLNNPGLPLNDWVAIDGTRRSCRETQAARNALAFDPLLLLDIDHLDPFPFLATWFCLESFARFPAIHSTIHGLFDGRQ